MKVIAFSGWKESGKDMCADFLVNDYNYKRLAFADPLKVMVAEQYSIPLKHMYDRNFKEKAIVEMPVSPRDGFSKKIAYMLQKEFRCKQGYQYDRFDIIDTEFCGRDNTNNDIPLYWTPRALCILEGSVKRSADPGYWVDRAIDSAADEVYVISDLRYCNEANNLIRLQKSGKIEKLLIIRIDRWETSPSDDPSERDLDNYEFDHCINNMDSQDIAERQVYDQLEDILERVSF